MADNKSGRDKQAHDETRRQQERAIAEELERGDEPEPPIPVGTLVELESEVEALEFPATGADIVAVVGDRELDSADRTYTVAELIPDTDAETFDAPTAVRTRVQRPTVATAMKRIVEASQTLPDTADAVLRGSQRDAYERTLRELEAIDADDEDEGVQAITDWILERIDEKGELPGSRDVRREAAKFCRANGYQVRNDEWLGV